MLHTPIPDPQTIEPISRQSLQDYDRVRKIIAYLTERASRQPSLDDVAAHVGLSASHVHALFRRWAGITPKEFLAAVTLDHAKRLLSDQASVLDATYETGLSGPGRLHDLFVTHEAMSPGEWKQAGAGLVLRYGFHPSPFGEALAVITDRGLAGLGWVDQKSASGTAATDGKAAGGHEGSLADMQRRWPNARFVQDQEATAPYVARAFDPREWRADRPLRVVLIGSDFEVRVWETLIGIPVGRATTYSNIACKLGNPNAARAVGAAVGKNPISFVVPCHRVLGKSGALTGYHWGVTRKQAILGWEAGKAAA
ncbi:bifunctional helix-turn-helix domain-containing protein/methylated-DNA--[protein]-cysteine S-methyltransferase [Terrarubrum flagellatum]|uniref:bifunctional helix-turn-helix domain-containing protein/methylated-DNA--[protein]-cysteine S-methyltransferase n=1 Tax=Terrirubrum flagellatum TaxID=2895980 RepID=UPI003144F3C0